MAEEVQNIYDDEVNRTQPSGLMSLLRGTGDFIVGSDILEGLPQEMESLTKVSEIQGLLELGGGSPEGVVEFSTELAGTPGLDDLGIWGVLLSLAGPGSKGKGYRKFQELLDTLRDEAMQDPKLYKKAMQDSSKRIMESKARGKARGGALSYQKGYYGKSYH
jgi:hypothetical protein